MKDEKKALGGRGRHAGVTPEFRAEAVRLVETSGRSVAAIAEDLGIEIDADALADATSGGRSFVGASLRRQQGAAAASQRE